MSIAPGRIVVLNGVGSAGKSSIARALQRIASRPFLHVQMDSFLDMMPPAYFDHDDGLRFVDRGEAGVEILCGSFASRVLDGMRQSIAAMAKSGNDLIVDDVMLGEDAKRYRAALAGLTVHWVGVMASPATLEARERQRGDRMAGLARWQFSRVHQDIVYDLIVETDGATPEWAASCIRDRFGL